MKKFLILSITLLLILSGCSYSRKSSGDNNQAPSVQPKNNIQIPVVSSSTPIKEQSTEDGLKKALLVKYPKIQMVSVSSIKTDKDASGKDIRAVGNDITDPQREDIAGNMGAFLAIKNNDGSWEIVYDGNGRPTCAELKSELIQYNFSDYLLEAICNR